MSENHVPANKPLYELKSFDLCEGDDPYGLFIKFLVDNPQTGSCDEEMYFHYSVSNQKEGAKEHFRDFLKEIEQKIDEMPS